MTQILGSYLTLDYLTSNAARQVWWFSGSALAQDTSTTRSRWTLRQVQVCPLHTRTIWFPCPAAASTAQLDCGPSVIITKDAFQASNFMQEFHCFQPLRVKFKGFHFSARYAQLQLRRAWVTRGRTSGKKCGLVLFGEIVKYTNISPIKSN